MTRLPCDGPLDRHRHQSRGRQEPSTAAPATVAHPQGVRFRQPCFGFSIGHLHLDRHEGGGSRGKDGLHREHRASAARSPTLCWSHLRPRGRPWLLRGVAHLEDHHAPRSRPQHLTPSRVKRAANPVARIRQAHALNAAPVHSPRGHEGGRAQRRGLGLQRLQFLALRLALSAQDGHFHATRRPRLLGAEDLHHLISLPRLPGGEQEHGGGGKPLAVGDAQREPLIRFERHGGRERDGELPHIHHSEAGPPFHLHRLLYQRRIEQEHRHGTGDQGEQRRFARLACQHDGTGRATPRRRGLCRRGEADQQDGEGQMGREGLAQNDGTSWVGPYTTRERPEYSASPMPAGLGDRRQWREERRNSRLHLLRGS